MEMLTGNGQPPKHLKGQLGQHYKDLKTGDMYELVSANEFSTIHHAPVRGYIWKRVARGDHMEVCAGGSGEGGAGGAGPKMIMINVKRNSEGETITANVTYEEARSMILSGEPILHFFTKVRVEDVDVYACTRTVSDVQLNSDSIVWTPEGECSFEYMPDGVIYERDW